MPYTQPDHLQTVTYCDMCRQLKPMVRDNSLCSKCREVLMEGWNDLEETGLEPIEELVLQNVGSC